MPPPKDSKSNEKSKEKKAPMDATKNVSKIRAEPKTKPSKKKVDKKEKKVEQKRKSIDSNDAKEKKASQQVLEKKEDVKVNAKRPTLQAQIPRRSQMHGQNERKSINPPKKPSMTDQITKRVSQFQNGELKAIIAAKEEQRKSTANRNSKVRGSKVRASCAKHFETLQYAKDGLRSTTTCSVSSTASNLKNEIIGQFASKQDLNRITFTDKTVELFHLQCDYQNLFAKFDVDEKPILMALIQDGNSKDAIFILSNKHNITVWESVDESTFEQSYDEPIKGTFGKLFERPVSSFDPVTKTFGFAFERNHMNIMYWKIDQWAHKTFPVEPKLLLNMLLQQHHNNNSILVYTQSRGLEIGNMCMDKNVRTLNMVTLELSEYDKNPQQYYRPGHLISIPSPLFGLVELCPKHIKYQKNEMTYSMPLDDYQNTEYKTFGVLSSSKAYAVTHKNEIILIHLCVDKAGSNNVVHINVQFINHTFNNLMDVIRNTEFLMCVRMTDSSVKYLTLERQRPSLKYCLIEIENGEDNDEEPPSPPPIKTNDKEEPVPVLKNSKPTTGDCLQGKWELKEKMGKGSFAYVMRVEDKINGKMSVLKVQKCDESKECVVNELKFLNDLKNRNIKEGFASILDSFKHCDFWFCIVLSDEGRPLLPLLHKAPTKMKMKDENVERIGYQITNIVASLQNLGYVHRDIHLSNCLVKKHSDGLLKVSLIDYGYVMETEKTVETKRMACQHASIAVCKDQRYRPWDDFYSVQHCLLQLSGYNLYSDVKKDENGADKVDDLIQIKERYDRDPTLHLNDEHEWIGSLYLLIKQSAARGLSPSQDVIQFFRTKHRDAIEYKEDGNGSFIIL